MEDVYLPSANWDEKEKAYTLFCNAMKDFAKALQEMRVVFRAWQKYYSEVDLSIKNLDYKINNKSLYENSEELK